MSFIKKHLDFVALIILLVLIIGFYWSFTTKYVFPTGDGALALSFYSQAYGSYRTYGNIMYWNPYLAGGSESNLAGYIMQGINPVNPILNASFFLSMLLDLKVISSFYLYYLSNIFIAAVFMYYLGKKHLFGDSIIAFFSALMLTCSGFIVSTVAEINLILPFIWLPAIIFFGLNALKEEKLLDYYFLALVLSFALANYSTVSIPVLVYAFAFFIPTIVDKIKNKSLTKNSIAKIGLFLMFCLIFNFGTLYIYTKYREVGFRKGVYYTFIGEPLATKNTDEIINFQWLLASFIPNVPLAELDVGGNKGQWFNGYYYIGFFSPILIALGILGLRRTPASKLTLSSIFAATLISICIFQGLAIIKLDSRIATLLMWPFYSRPLILFSFILLAAYGLNTLFSKHEEATLLNKLLQTVIPAVYATLLVVLIGLQAVNKESITTASIVVTLAYTIVFGLLYLTTYSLNNKGMFIVVFFIDVVFFLSGSNPLTALPKVKVGGNIIANKIDNSLFIQKSDSLSYSTSIPYLGMHFGDGPTVLNEYATPDIMHALMPLRRPLYAQQQLSKYVNADNLSKFNGLKVLGVSSKKYLLVENALVVNDYEQIFPTLIELYKNASSYNANLTGDFAVISKNEPTALSNSSLKIPTQEEITLYENNDDYLKSNMTQHEIVSATASLADFTKIDTPDGQPLYKYNGKINNVGGLVTENSTMQNVCISIKDAKNDYYYPITNDIFNFVPHQNGSDYVYMIEYKKFYGTYLNGAGEVELFIRTDDFSNENPLTINYSKECLNKSVNSLPLNLEAKEIKISDPKIDIETIMVPNNIYSMAYRMNLSRFNVPSYLNSYLNRVHLMSDNTNRSKLSFAVSNSVLDILVNELNPNLDKQLKINYKILKRDIYDSKEELVPIKEEPDEITIRTLYKKNSLLVVRNTYDTDWTATIDGKTSNIYIVNGVHMGIPVPQGEHEITLRYYPKYYKGFVNAMNWILFPLPLIFLLILKLRGQKKQVKS